MKYFLLAFFLINSVHAEQLPPGCYKPHDSNECFVPKDRLVEWERIIGGPEGIAMYGITVNVLIDKEWSREDESKMYQHMLMMTEARLRDTRIKYRKLKTKLKRKE